MHASLTHHGAAVFCSALCLEGRVACEAVLGGQRSHHSKLWEAHWHTTPVKSSKVSSASESRYNHSFLLILVTDTVKTIHVAYQRPVHVPRVMKDPNYIYLSQQARKSLQSQKAVRKLDIHPCTLTHK